LNFSTFSKSLSVRGNIFSTIVSNPVVNVTLLTTPNLITRQRQNAGRTHARGLEFDAEVSLRSNLKLSASYLLVDSRVTNFPANSDLNGKFLPQIPGQQLSAQINYRPHRNFFLSFQTRISGSQFEDDLNALRLRPFFTLDAFASYKLPKRISIITAVENVFNNRYDIGLTPNRITSAPRFVRFGLSFGMF
jgi:outer membrane receptor protein involved in Fe transport